MKRKFGWKHVAWIAGTALVVWIIAGIVLAGRDLPPFPSSQQTIDLHGGHVQNNRITTKSWSFDYTHAQLSADGSSGNIDGVRNGVVFRKGKPYLKIAAEHIAVNITSLDFTAIGKVHVDRIDDPDRRSFDTDLVEWTNNAKLLRLDHPSYVHTGDETLRLDNVKINFDTNDIQFGKIGGSVQVPSSPRPSTSSALRRACPSTSQGDKGSRRVTLSVSKGRACRRASVSKGAPVEGVGARR